jgi:hypothetical protein
MFSGYRGISQGIQWVERDPDHSPPSTYSFNNIWCHISVSALRLHAILFSGRGKCTLNCIIQFSSVQLFIYFSVYATAEMPVKE